jgi:hypothetical protein
VLSAQSRRASAVIGVEEPLQQPPSGLDFVPRLPGLGDGPALPPVEGPATPPQQ